jgi:hypothetical protein
MIVLLRFGVQQHPPMQMSDELRLWHWLFDEHVE